MNERLKELAVAFLEADNNNGPRDEDRPWLFVSEIVLIRFMRDNFELHGKALIIDDKVLTIIYDDQRDEWVISVCEALPL